MNNESDLLNVECVEECDFGGIICSRNLHCVNLFVSDVTLAGSDSHLINFVLSPRLSFEFRLGLNSVLDTCLDEQLANIAYDHKYIKMRLPACYVEMSSRGDPTVLVFRRLSDVTMDIYLIRLHNLLVRLNGIRVGKACYGVFSEPNVKNELLRLSITTIKPDFYPIMKFVFNKVYNGNTLLSLIFNDHFTREGTSIGICPRKLYMRFVRSLTGSFRDHLDRILVSDFQICELDVGAIVKHILTVLAPTLCNFGVGSIVSLDHIVDCCMSELTLAISVMVDCISHRIFSNMVEIMIGDLVTLPEFDTGVDSIDIDSYTPTWRETTVRREPILCTMLRDLFVRSSSLNGNNGSWTGSDDVDHVRKVVNKQLRESGVKFCHEFMKNGNCKFGDKCKFSHGPENDGGCNLSSNFRRSYKICTEDVCNTISRYHKSDKTCGKTKFITNGNSSGNPNAERRLMGKQGKVEVCYVLCLQPNCGVDHYHPELKPRGQNTDNFNLLDHLSIDDSAGFVDVVDNNTSASDRRLAPDVVIDLVGSQENNGSLSTSVDMPAIVQQSLPDNVVVDNQLEDTPVVTDKNNGAISPGIDHLKVQNVRIFYSCSFDHDSDLHQQVTDYLTLGTVLIRFSFVILLFLFCNDFTNLAHRDVVFLWISFVACIISGCYLTYCKDHVIEYQYLESARVYDLELQRGVIEKYQDMGLFSGYAGDGLHVLGGFHSFTKSTGYVSYREVDVYIHLCNYLIDKCLQKSLVNSELCVSNTFNQTMSKYTSEYSKENSGVDFERSVLMNSFVYVKNYLVFVKYHDLASNPVAKRDCLKIDYRPDMYFQHQGVRE